MPTSMRRSWPDLLAVMVLAVAGAAAALIPPSPEALRVALTLPLMLLWPGYALTAAVFAARPLNGEERLLFSLALSLVVSVLGGLALHWSPWGLATAAWAGFLAGVTLGAGVVAVRRRRRRPEAARRLSLGLTINHCVLLGLAALATIGALGVATNGATAPPTTGFTQLWLLPADPIDQDALRLGVASMELEATRYRLEVTADSAGVGEWASIELRPGERWEATVALPAALADATRVEAKLYRLADPVTVYRRVSLWRGQSRR